MHLRSRPLLSAFALTAGLGLLTTGGAHAAELDQRSAAEPDIVQKVAFESKELPPLERLRPKAVEVRAFTCSEEHPWLLKRTFEMSDDVPISVEVDRGRLVRVKIEGEPAIDDATGYATGWLAGENTAANWHLSDTSFATITAHCTSDPAKAYKASTDQP